jgi:hypothetical protein
MSDPVIDKLTRFTPTDRLDRDDVLFRAGRASAPGRKGWIALAGLLTATQVTTMSFWFVQSPPRNPVIPDLRSPNLPDDLRFPERPAPDSYGSLRATWDGNTLPVPSVEPVPAEPLTLRSIWSDPALK